MLQKITNINSYLNNMKMETIWNINKQDPEKAKIQKQQKQQQISKKISDIRSKLKFGKKLSDKELRLLKEHAPDLYKKAEAIQQERKNFEEALKNCKTKDDVQRLFSQKMQLSMSLEKVDKEMAEYMTAALQDEHSHFTASDDYKNLKWESEQTKESEKVSKKNKKSNHTDSVDEIYHKVLKRAEEITGHLGIENTETPNKEDTEIQSADVQNIDVQNTETIEFQNTDVQQTNYYTSETFDTPTILNKKA